MVAIADKREAMMDQCYSADIDVPSVEDYCRLREDAGLNPRSAAAAESGFPNTAVGLVVRCGARAIGIGRVIGDGLFYQVVDIAVEPKHQRQGLGKAIMANLMEELRRIAPAEAYVGLIADGKASKLYTDYGFQLTAPESIGCPNGLTVEPRGAS
jgi:ribosomal protein S18 acetylase RimI-like enzyme